MTIIRRSRRSMGARAHTLRASKLSLRELLEIKRLGAEAARVVAEYERPRVRGDCLSGGCNEGRPCPWVSCRYHLALDVTEAGSLTIRFPDREVWEMTDTCCLDVAEEGDDLTLERIGGALNVVRERVRQVEDLAMGQLRANSEHSDIVREDLQEIERLRDRRLGWVPSADAPEVFGGMLEKVRAAFKRLVPPHLHRVSSKILMGERAA
jgi:hypothetical protein